MRIAIGFLFIVLTIGMIEGALILGGDALGGERFPSWPVWQYLTAALAVGIFYLIAECVLHPITSFLIDADRVGDPLWKRGLRVLGIIIFVCGVAVLVLLMAARWNRAA